MLRKTTRTRRPDAVETVSVDAVETVSVHPAAALADPTVSVTASVRLITTEPAVPAWKVACVPMAGADALFFVDGSHVSLAAEWR